MYIHAYTGNGTRLSFFGAAEAARRSSFFHIFNNIYNIYTHIQGMALDSRSSELRRQHGDPPFSSLDWSYFNSAREGWVLNSLTNVC